MASQPVARPWFRLSSMARPPTQPALPSQDTQPAAPNPQPRPPLLRPTFTTSISPPTPPPPVSAPTRSPPPPPSSSPPPPSVSSQPPPQSPPPPTAVPIAAATSMPSSPVSRNSIYPNLALGTPASTRIPVTSSSPSSPTAKTVAPTNASPISNSPLPKISTRSRNSPVFQTAAFSPAKTNLPVPRTVGTVSPLPTAAVPNSPASKFIGTNSIPNSSPPKLNSLYSPSASNGSVTTTSVRHPTPSPKFTKQPLAQSPPNSPNITARAPPPSPLLLPPSMLNPDTEMAPKYPIEAEQKSVVTQQTMEKPSSNWVNENSPKTVPNPSAHHGKTHEKGSHHKKTHNSDENGMRVITIAGENRGAFMELSHSHKKQGHFEGISHSLLHKKNGNDSETSSNDEVKLKMKDENHKNMVNAYMNSNVQGVNNSIVFNSAYTHHDPGVHLSLTRKPNKDNAHQSNGYHS